MSSTDDSAEKGSADGVTTDKQNDANGFDAPVQPSSSLSMRFLGAKDLEEPDGTWKRGTWLLATSTAQPVLLSLPYAMACLGWAGGLVVLTISGLVTTYCNLLIARLHHYGGKRHEQYRTLAKAVMGEKHPYAYYTVLILQFSVIIGVGIANIILSAQCLQAIYLLYCTDGDCPIRNALWALIAGLVLMVLAQCPDMARAEVLTAVTTAFMVTYSIAAVALAGTQGGGEGADYSIPGNTINRVMNGFNAIGMAAFVFTNNIVPEIQATLKTDNKSGSAYPPMKKAIVGTSILITPMFLLVAIVGYWAYGNTVSSFLLNESSHPRWLLTILNLMCVFQLLVGEQIFEFVLYDSWEPRVVRAFPRATWLHTESRNAEGRRVLVPNRICMLLVRVPYIAVITVLAAALPFIAEVMGVIGSIGLTPLAFIFPIILYLAARGSELSRLSYWAHAALAALFTCVGLLAAVGAVRSIVLAIEQHDFFS